jgi:hypothetical protein
MTVITGDESSVYGYGPETKTRSSQWKTLGSLRLKRYTNFGARWEWCWWFSSIWRCCSLWVCTRWSNC